MKKVKGLLGACAMLLCGVVSAQVKDMPGGPRVNQLNLPDGVTQIAKDIAWLHGFMLIVCMVIFIAVFSVMSDSVHRSSATKAVCRLGMLAEVHTFKFVLFGNTKPDELVDDLGDDERHRE